MLLSRPLLRIIRNDGLEKAYIDVWMWCCANWPHTGLPQLNIVSQIGLRLLRLMGWNGKLKSIERGYPATPKNDDVARFSGSSSLISAMKLDAVLMTFSVGSRHSERSLYHIADAAMPTHNYIVTHELLTIFFLFAWCCHRLESNSFGFRIEQMVGVTCASWFGLVISKILSAKSTRRTFLIYFHGIWNLRLFSSISKQHGILYDKIKPSELYKHLILNLIGFHAHSTFRELCLSQRGEHSEHLPRRRSDWRLCRRRHLSDRHTYNTISSVPVHLWCDRPQNIETQYIFACC